MSNRTKILAAAAFLAVAAIPGLASAQAASNDWYAAYNAGAPGPYRPHPQVRAHMPHVQAAPSFEYETGAFQGSAGAAYQLGGAQ
jgi:hypothetical protein